MLSGTDHCKISTGILLPLLHTVSDQKLEVQGAGIMSQGHKSYDAQKEQFDPNFC